MQLFSPYLSKAIANRVLRHVPDQTDFHVIEIGAGRATLARDILQSWQHLPHVANRIKYTIVEISHALARIQETTLRPWIANGTAQVCRASAVDWFQANTSSIRGHCHIIATEVLDNLPHDFVRQSQTLEQAHVGETDEGHRFVQWTDCTDPHILNTIDAYRVLDAPTHTTNWASFLRDAFDVVIADGFRYIWVPTISYQLLQAITSSLQHAHLTITDFHSLPGALAGVNAPVVQSTRGGTAVVYDHVHSAPFGQVDIMFPTDFNSLSNAHAFLTPNSTPFRRRIMSQRDFFQQFASDKDIDSSTCANGYNPILQDFENVSFLLIDPPINGANHYVQPAVQY